MKRRRVLVAAPRAADYAHPVLSRRLLTSCGCFAITACNLLLGNEVGSLAPESPDASELPDAVPPRDAAPDAPPPEQGCTAVHVSASGDDQNTGCLPSAPKRTIGAGMAYAVSFSLPVVRVCSGEYVEHLLMEAAVSLQGGYDCADFSRPELDETALTTVLRAPANNPLRPATVTVQGALGRDVRIEGLRIVGGDEAENDSIALLVQRGADVTLERVAAEGGGSPRRAIGLQIHAASPLVKHSRFVGGHSRCEKNNVGNVGVLVGGHVDDAAGPRFEDNTMIGGPASCATTDAYSSIGLVLYSGNYQGDSKLLRNSIEGYRATAAPNEPQVGAVAGLFSNVANLELEECALSAGDLTRTSGDAVGLALQDLPTGPGALRLSRSRLRGSLLRARDGAVSTSYGFASRGRSELYVHDSIVHSGDIAYAEPAPALTGSSVLRSAHVVDAAVVQVSHSTFVLGTMPASRSAEALLLNSTVPGDGGAAVEMTVSLEHNLFASGTSLRDRALWFSPRVIFKSLHSNGFGPFEFLAMQQNGVGCARLANLDTCIEGGSANVEVVRSGDTCFDESCIALDCTDCNEVLFDGYEPENPVVFVERAAADGPGFPLRPTAPCLLVARPGGAVRTDLLGTPRSGGTSSAGAHEASSALCTDARP